MHGQGLEDLLQDTGILKFLNCGHKYLCLTTVYTCLLVNLIEKLRASFEPKVMTL